MNVTDPAATLGDVLGTVVRVHGKRHPGLADLQRLFATMRGELEIHMRREEHTLFPALLQALRALEPDLHQHIHEENNVLFPRVRERVAAAA